MASSLTMQSVAEGTKSEATPIGHVIEDRKRSTTKSVVLVMTCTLGMIFNVWSVLPTQDIG
jgi:hypothetical protein